MLSAGLVHMIQIARTLPSRTGVEQIDRLQARSREQRRRLPETLHPLGGPGMIEQHVRGNLVGQATDLAPTHGVRLPRDAERPRTGLADTTGREVGVDDPVDFVRPGARLVHALREQRHRARRGREPLVEGRNVGRVEAGQARHVHVAGGLEGRGDAGRVLVDPLVVERADAAEMFEQASKQRDVTAGGERELEVGALAGRGAAGVDDDELGAAYGPGRLHALEQHWVAPGEVAADEDNEVGLLEILVDAGDDVGAERADMAGDGGRHAKAGIRVDVGRAEEALHQLVGDVVILGKTLAGNIEGHAIRAVLGDGRAECVGDAAERVIPTDAFAVDGRVMQPALIG